MPTRQVFGIHELDIEHGPRSFLVEGGLMPSLNCVSYCMSNEATLWYITYRISPVSKDLDIKNYVHCIDMYCGASAIRYSAYVPHVILLSLHLGHRGFSIRTRLRTSGLEPCHHTSSYTFSPITPPLECLQALEDLAALAFVLLFLLPCAPILWFHLPTSDTRPLIDFPTLASFRLLSTSRGHRPYAHAA